MDPGGGSLKKPDPDAFEDEGTRILPIQILRRQRFELSSTSRFCVVYSMQFFRCLCVFKFHLI